MPDVDDPCPICGNPISALLAQGLCPRCLLARSLDDGDGLEAPLEPPEPAAAPPAERPTSSLPERPPTG